MKGRLSSIVREEDLEQNKNCKGNGKRKEVGSVAQVAQEVFHLVGHYKVRNM